MMYQTLGFLMLAFGFGNATPTLKTTDENTKGINDLKTAESNRIYSDFGGYNYPNDGFSGYGVTGHGYLDDKYNNYGGYGGGSYNSIGYNGYGSYPNYGYSGGYGGYKGNQGGYGYRGSYGGYGNGGYGGYGGNGGLNSYYGYNNPNYYGSNHLGYGYYGRSGIQGHVTPSLVTGYRGYSK